MIRGELPQETVVEAVDGTKVSLNGKNGLPNTKHSHKSTRCERCGKLGFHSRAQCPAKDFVCYKCGKLGHYKSVCRSKSVAVRPRVQEVTASDESDSFLGPIYANNVLAVQENSAKWTKSLQVNQRKMAFKINTGAESRNGLLQSTDRQLTGAGQQPLKV